jgi:hypothetical protein
LTIWKKSSQRTNKPEQAGKNNTYFELKKEIKPLREQGELPTKVPGSFGRHYCDLCNSTFPVEDLRQCSLCGRWVCNSCFTNEYYICNSCNGILKLYMTRE